MLRILVTFLILLGSCHAGYKYELSVCAIFQNEAPYLREWIEFHRLLGAEYFWLYNNNSTDNYLQVLQPYIAQGVVKLIDWPSPPDADWTPYQINAYNDCIQRSKEKTKWLAVIDLDEFIVSTNSKTIPEILKSYDKYGGVFIFWQMYGTSGIFEIPANKTLIESLVYKAPTHYGENYQGKTICRPKTVKYYHVHGPEYLSGYHDVSLSKNGPPHNALQVNPMRVNHYWTKDEKFFLEVKVPRRTRCCHAYSEAEINFFLTHFNSEHDPAALPWVPKLRKRLGLTSAQ